jgi:beta-lactamase regulating signal transducer with metallopeptidase domain
MICWILGMAVGGFLLLVARRVILRRKLKTTDRLSMVAHLRQLEDENTYDCY